MRSAGSGIGTIYYTLAWVTVGLLLLLMLYTFGSAHTVYSALSSAAQEAAWSGQAQFEKVGQDGAGRGYFRTRWEMNTGAVQQAAEAAWRANVANLKLDRVFSNLRMEVSAVGTSVTVVATAEYRPPWLTKALSKVFGGQFSETVVIPMRVTATGSG